MDTLVTLRREVDGEEKVVHVGTWHQPIDRVYRAMLSYEVYPVPETEFGPAQRTLEAATATAEGFVAKLRAEGWKEALTAAETERIAARRAAGEDEAERYEHDLARRLAAFPASALDRRLAAAIAEPTGVTVLDLRGTEGDRLSVVPPSIVKLKDLEVLHLEGNALPELPEEMLDGLENLRVARLAHNRLRDARPISYQRQLALLDLFDNQLDECTAGYRQKKLELHVGRNPIVPGGFVTNLSKGVRVFGIDTDSLFPIRDDKTDGPTRGLEILQLYGRAPTGAERAQVAKYFPKARIDFVGEASEARVLFAAGSEAPAKPARAAGEPRRKPGKLHAEQASHRRDILARSKKQGVPERAVKGVMRPCVELLAHAATEADLAAGKTRLGGAPDLPPGAPWPAGVEGPMIFVGQIDLADVAAYDPERLLPARGLLLFFAGDYDEGRVLFVENGAATVATAAPDDAVFGKAEQPPFPACGVRFRGAMSLPNAIEDDDDERFFPVYLGHREREGEEAIHRVLGLDFGDTDTIEEDDVVLLAVGSDERAGMMWGDAGTLYFVIDREALAKRQWARARVTSTD